MRRYPTEADQGHRLHGYSRCADVWLCPVCGVAISLRRQTEVQQACQVHIDAGGQIAMLTLTVPHHRGDSLADLVDRMNRALRRMKQWRAWRKLQDDVQLLGMITAREATWGQRTGWHPHFHAVLLIGPRVDAGDLELRIGELWRAAVQRELGRATNAHGCCVSVRDDADAPKTGAAYLVKGAWDLSRELTGAASKEARAGRYTVAELMRALHACDGAGRMKAARYWRRIIEQYRAAYRGRAQLTWTPGLKARLAVTEVTDQAAAEEAPEWITTAFLNHWGAERVRLEGLQNPVLVAADADGFEGVARLLARWGIEVGRHEPPAFGASGALAKGDQ